VKIFWRILVALLFMAIMGAGSFGLFFRSKIGGPDYRELLERVSGQRLVCGSPLGGITLSFNKQDLSLEVEVEGRRTILGYDGSHDFTDYFVGSNGEEIVIDPEIKLSGFSGDIGGLCWEG
jgi:hypothetical protein